MVIQTKPTITLKTAILERPQDGSGNVIKIQFPFNLKDVTLVKTLVGRRYHPLPEIHWTCPLTLLSAECLLRWGFVLDDTLLRYIKKKRSPADQIQEDLNKIKSIPGLQKTPYPFQMEGVNMIEKWNGRVLLADEQGLGKTIQALAWLQLHPEIRPVIIITPSSLKLKWQREALTWMSGPKIQILSNKHTKFDNSCQIYVISYDMVAQWLPVLLTIGLQCCIIDEVHKIKNSKAKRIKSFKQVVKNIPKLIAISGTPSINRPVELYNILNILQPKMFNNFITYTHRYCGAKHNGFGWDFNGSSNMQELNQILVNSVMIRRLKKDVLKDLPPKTYSVVPFEIDNWQEYQEAEQDFIQFVKINKGDEAADKVGNAEHLAKIEGLKQLTMQGKLNGIVEWIKDFLEGGNKKLVVMCIHKFVVAQLEEAFKDICVKVVGGMSDKAKDDAELSFQTNPDIRLFIGNIQSAGVGLTLTAASDLAIIELPWTPGEMEQAEDRIHRITQTGNVLIHFLLAYKTIEEKIVSLLDSKREVMSLLLDGKVADKSKLLGELIYANKTKYKDIPEQEVESLVISKRKEIREDLGQKSILGELLNMYR